MFICIESGVFSNQANSLNMQVNKKIELHTKCLAVLCIIGRINDKITADEITLGNWDRARWDDVVKLTWRREEIESRIETGYATRERLVNYYEKTAGKLHETAVQE